MSTRALEPCPFCGGDTKVIYSDKCGWQVGCIKCACKISYFISADEAVEAWNRRTNSLMNELLQPPIIKNLYNEHPLMINSGTFWRCDHGMTSFQSCKLCHAAANADERRDREHKDRAHKWDLDGERCTICGDKDWMGGPCSGPRDESILLSHEKPLAWLSKQTVDDLLKEKPWTAGATGKFCQRECDDYDVPVYLHSDRAEVQANTDAAASVNAKVQEAAWTLVDTIDDECEHVTSDAVWSAKERLQKRLDAAIAKRSQAAAVEELVEDLQMVIDAHIGMRAGDEGAPAMTRRVCSEAIRVIREATLSISGEKAQTSPSVTTGISNNKMPQSLGDHSMQTLASTNTHNKSEPSGVVPVDFAITGG